MFYWIKYHCIKTRLKTFMFLKLKMLNIKENLKVSLDEEKKIVKHKIKLSNKGINLYKFIIFQFTN